MAAVTVVSGFLFLEQNRVKDKLTSITSNSVLGVQLVGHIGVVLPSTTLTNGRFHQTRQRRKNVNGRVDALVVELTVNEDLTLSNVASQVGNRVGDI